MAFWSRWTKAVRPDPGPEAGESASSTQESAVLLAVGRLVAALPGVDLVLNPPASAALVQQVEAEVGFELPTDVRELYLAHDGQPSSGAGLLAGRPLLPLAEALDEWQVWKSVGGLDMSDIPSMSEPAGAVREVYTNPRWFPLCIDGGGNNLGVDCDPGPAGTRGQLINFGRDEEVKYAHAPSLTAFLTRLAELAEGGRAVLVQVGEQVWWGIDNAQAQWPRYRDFTSEQRDEVADQAWYAALEPAWQQRIGGPERLYDFLTAAAFSSFPDRDQALAQVTSLEPMGRTTNLRQVIIHTRVLEALTDLPALPRLAELIVSTRSHAGIERFPLLATYRVGKQAPAADLGPLRLAPCLTTVALLGAPHPDLSPLQGCARLTSLEVRPIDAAQLQQIGRLSGLRELTVDLSDVGEPVDTLDFLDQLPDLTTLTISGLTGTDIAAVGRMPRVRSVTLRSSEDLVNVAALAGASTLQAFSGGYAAFDVLKDLRPDLSFARMEGRLTAEQEQQWLSWLDRPGSRPGSSWRPPT